MGSEGLHGRYERSRWSTGIPNSGETFPYYHLSEMQLDIMLGAGKSLPVFVKRWRGWGLTFRIRD